MYFKHIIIFVYIKHIYYYISPSLKIIFQGRDFPNVSELVALKPGVGVRRGPEDKRWCKLLFLKKIPGRGEVGQAYRFQEGSWSDLSSLVFCERLNY